MAIFPIASNKVQLSTAAPAVTDAVVGSILLDAGDTVARAATTGGVSVSDGLLFTALGQVVAVDATAGLPAGTQYTNGLPISPLGAMCVSTDNAATYSNGIPFVANGAVAAAGLGAAQRMSVVATHQAPPNGTNNSNQDIMSRSTFVATDAISVMALVFVNWFNEETALGASSATVQAGIEYPLGTSRGTFTFSAGATGTIAAGQQITSDTKTLGVTIPAGATFAIRTFWHNNDGLLFCTAIQDANNDMRFGATGVVTNSVGGVGLLSGGGSGFGGLEYRPTLVLGMTAKNVYFITGDSKCRAFNDAPDPPYGPTGNVQRSIPVTTPSVNLGVDSEQLVNVVANMTTPGQSYYQRTQWIKTYASKVIMELGVNDIYNSARSAAQITADIATFKTQVSGLTVIPCTIGPNTTSTDSWATLVNQTVKAQEGVRLTYNTATRALGSQNFIDVARFIDPTDTAKWPVNGVANKYTSDGLHESFDGYALEQTNGTPQLTWVA